VKAVPLGTIDFDDVKFKRLVELGEQISRIDSEELTPESVRFAVLGIEGLTYTDSDLANGSPANTEDLVNLLLERGPDELYNEIVLAVAKELGLLPAEQTNLGLPSTSAGAVDGNAGPGSAERAGSLVTIMSADVPSSTAPASASAASTA